MCWSVCMFSPNPTTQLYSAPRDEETEVRVTSPSSHSRWQGQGQLSSGCWSMFLGELPSLSLHPAFPCWTSSAEVPSVRGGTYPTSPLQACLRCVAGPWTDTTCPSTIFSSWCWELLPVRDLEYWIQASKESCCFVICFTEEIFAACLLGNSRLSG